MAEIKRRERDAILQSLQAGLVPRLGLHLLQVGRKEDRPLPLVLQAPIESCAPNGIALVRAWCYATHHIPTFRGYFLHLELQR